MNARVPLFAQQRADEVSAAKWADVALDEMMKRVLAELAPPEPLTIIEWAERYRILSEEESSDFPGAYTLEMTPVLRGILAVLGDRNVRRVVCQKSAQLGYTAGVVCNLLGYHAHWKPCVQVVMFPREQSAKDFAAEKFDPMVRATPPLAERIRLKSRADGNSTTRKTYPGGRIKLVASKSPSDVKSTSAKVIVVEEPDDTDKNVKGQGDSINLLRNRKKTVNESIELIGGTPTAAGASKIENEMRVTDQRRFYVPCHACNEEHELSWSCVTIPGTDLTEEDAKKPEVNARWPLRDVYGRARWEEAFYSCPHCGTLWSDQDRVANIRRAAVVAPLFGWRPGAESPIPGFYCSELQSVFAGSYIPLLAERYLEAKHYEARGEHQKMIDFQNGTLGLPWDYKGELPEEDELRQRAEKYAEWTSPVGGLVPLLTVDVQHDRLAVQAWTVGRGEEQWLAFWGELHGQTMVAHAGAWLELEQMLERRVRHASGATMPLAAVAIDSGDGQTTDAVYAFCRKHHRRDRPVLPTKGASDKVGRVEIWTAPRAVDPNQRSTKASRQGVLVHIVGAAKAKDLILGWATDTGRVRLQGNGPGRMHWYEGVRDDFFEQLLGEMKIPTRYDRHVREWKERTDRRNEGLDCCVLSVWLSRHLRLHLKKPVQWLALEGNLRQASLLPEPEAETPPRLSPGNQEAGAHNDDAPADSPVIPANAGIHRPEAAPPAVHTSAPLRRPTNSPLASPEWSSRL